MKKIIVGGAVVLALGGATWVVAGQLQRRPVSMGVATSSAPLMQAPTTTPAIVAPTATPNIITVGTSTQVLFTVSIPEVTLNPASVNLLRVNPNGTSTIVAQMVDNGQNGDQQPGDKMFTAMVTFNEAQAGEVKFQVSAAFRGVLRRSQSPLTSLPIWLPTTRSTPAGAISFAYPPGALVEQPNQNTILLISANASRTQEASYVSIQIKQNPTNTSVFDFYVRPTQPPLLEQSNNVYQSGVINGRQYFQFDPVITFSGDRVLVVVMPGYFIEITGPSIVLSSILSMLHIQ